MGQIGLIEVKDAKFVVGDYVTVSKNKQKKKLQKISIQIVLRKILLLKKLKIPCHGLTGEEIIGAFYKKELQKPN